MAESVPDPLLTVAEAAAHSGFSERFIRRLIAERRITYVKPGYNVFIATSVLAAFVRDSTVAPITRRSAQGRRAA